MSIFKNYLQDYFPRTRCSVVPQAFLATMNEAFQWLRQARKDYSDNSDIWHLCRNWSCEKERLTEALKQGTFQFDVVRRYVIDGEVKIVFAARDALVLKMLALYLGKTLLPVLPRQIFHLKDRGGLKRAVTELQAELPNYRFIIKTDIKGFYGSIQFEPLMAIVREKVSEAYLCDLIEQSLYRTDLEDGFYLDVTESLPMGSPLSPGALMLLPLSDYFGHKENVYFSVYMDDFVICCKTKHQQRRMLKNCINCLIR